MEKPVPRHRLPPGRFFAVPVYLYIVVGLGFFLSVADNASGRARVLPVAPTVAALAFLAPLAGFVVFGDGLRVPAFGRVIAVLRANAPVILPFFAIVCVSLACAFSSTAYWGDGAKWIYLNTYDFFIFIFAMFLPVIGFVRRYFSVLTLCGLAALLISIAIDVVQPGTFSSEPRRAAGFPGNSNWSALCTVMLCAATLRYHPAKYRLFDCLVLFLTWMGVIATLSRSGSLNLLLLTCSYCYITFFHQRRSMRQGLALVASLGVLALASAAVGPFLGELSYFEGASSRLSSFFGGKLDDDGSSAQRLNAALHSVELIEESPLLGHGTGYTRTMPMTPHNLYLNQWVNNGLLGVLAYVALLISGLFMFIRRRTWPGVGLMCVALIGSGFSHNVLEQRSFLILLGALSTASLLNPYASGARAVRGMALCGQRPG